MDCESLDDFIHAVDMYNMHHSRKLNYSHGVSRFAVIRADYVIKFDMTPAYGFEDGRAGNCDSEKAVYARAVEAGMAHLLAKTTLTWMNGRTVAIMPRIDHVSDEDRYWADYCTYLEYRWLRDNIYDLHSGNVGYRNGKVCVIDYAWDAINDDW
jgi:hypothetical protein